MKYIKILTAALVMLTAALLAGCSEKSADADPSELRVTFIDVGKGDCILIQKNGRNVLIDTGYDKTSADVINYLKSHGAGTIDELIITHFDKDHVGGADNIINELDVKNLYLPDYESESKHYAAMLAAASAKGITPVRVTEDIAFSADGAEFKIFASDVEYLLPADGGEGNDNDVSLVISLVYNSDSYLFTGDIEKDGIKSFLNKCGDSFDVIKMPHHGKKSGKTDELLESVHPKLAVITDSTDEPAADKVIGQLTELGCEIYRSSERGTFTITSAGEGNYKIN